MENESGVLRRRKNAIRHRSHFGGQVYGSGIRSLDAKDAYRRVGHIDKFNAVASAGRVLAVPVSDPGRSLELSTHLLKTLGKIIGAEASSLFGPRTLDQGLRSRRAKRSLRK